MPLVSITMLEGRSAEKKKAMFKAVTEAIVQTLGAPRESVRISIHEIPTNDYAIGGVARDDLDKQAQGKSK